MRTRPTSLVLAGLAAVATLAGTAGPASAAPVKPEIVDTYVTPVVITGISRAHQSVSVAATRDTTSVTVDGDRTTPGLCAGYTDQLEKGGPNSEDPTITEFGESVTVGPKDFVGYGANGCAGRWKLTFTATGPGGTDTAVAYQYLLRASRFTRTNAGPEPIRSGAVVTTSAVLQRASFADQRYHGWSTPVLLQFRTHGAWKTYRQLTATSTGAVSGAVRQRVTGCWRMVAPGTATTAPAVSPVDCVAVR